MVGLNVKQAQERGGESGLLGLWERAWLLLGVSLALGCGGRFLGLLGIFVRRDDSLFGSLWVVFAGHYWVSLCV